jgi:signal transduction histidine kinase
MDKRSKTSVRWWRRNFLHTYLVTIGLAVLPLAAFIEGAHKLLVRQVTNRVLSDSSNLGKLLATVVAHPLADDQRFLEGLAQRPDVTRSWQLKDDRELDAILSRAHKLHPDFAVIGLYDTNARLRAVSPPGATLLGARYGVSDLYGRVQAGDAAYFSPAYDQSSGSGYSLAVAVPLRDEGGKLLGIVVGQQTLEGITRDVYDYLTPTNRGLVFVVDPSHEVFGTKDSKIVPVPGDRLVIEKLSRGLANNKGEYLTVGSQEVIAAYAPIDRGGWGILVSVPLAAIREDLSRGERIFGFFGGLVLLLAIAGGGAVAAIFQRFRTREQEYQNQIETRNHELAARTADLAAANSELESFSYSVSHDLRAPLRHINGFSSILLEEAHEALSPEHREMLQRISFGAQNLSRLVDDLLTFSRFGRQALTLEIVDMKALVAGVVEEAEGELTGRDVEWILDPLPDTVCDQTLIRQVFRNLISNAVKFSATRERAIIKIGITIEGEEPTFYVRDNGVGFDMKYADKLFGVFQRLHQQEEFEGTGVGLAIVQRIILKHAGKVWVFSEQDRGTTFFFTLGMSPKDSASGTNATS